MMNRFPQLALAVVVLGCETDRDFERANPPVIRGISAAKIDSMLDTVPPGARGPVDTVDGARQMHFTQGRFKERLILSGIPPVDLGTVRHSFLGPVGRTYRVPGGEVQAFIYGDAVALARDLAAVDTGRVAPHGATIDWPATPSLLFTNNLAVIVLTEDSELRRRVREAIDSY